MSRASSFRAFRYAGRTALSIAALPIFALSWATMATAEAPHVVASIKPVHSLVAGVMGDIGTPHLLVTGADSPHTYAMRPSDASALSNADAIFWIGEEMETFLERPIENLGDDAVATALIDAPGMTLLNYDKGDAGEHEEHGHDEDHDEADHDGDDHHQDEGMAAAEGDEDHHEHEHQHHGLDAHVWLDPANARAMVAEIVATLSQVDPDNAGTYHTNGQSMSERLEALEATISEQLAPYHEAPYFTFHESFRYFDHRFGLNARGAISISPERTPGVQRLSEIRAEISELQGACIFAEPQFPPKLVDVIVEGTPAKTGTIDPLGAALTPGSNLYFDLMNSNAEAFVTCFSATN